MTETDIESARRRANQIQARYDAHFAGQPRVSRDASLLDTLIAESDRLLTELRSHRDGAALRDTVQKNRDLYRREAEAVRAAQNAPAEVLAAHEFAAWAQFTFNRYRRHFAGQARATRDLGLLAELIADLARFERSLAGLADRNDDPMIRSTLDQVRESLALYRSEQAAIAEARGAGTLQEQADILAAVANGQFVLYRAHFAGKSRVSRRPALLERMVETLATVADRMKALDAQGLRAESNTRNVGIVTERLALYREELERVRETRQQTSFQTLVSGLGEAANTVFTTWREQFAGKDRTTRDPQVLSEMCDALYDLARQMDDLDRVREDDTNQHNLAVVLDHLRLYEREYGLIQEAKAS
ncbi:MAG: hypothetical protein R3F65_29220 [bacterium]|nr:hypothetical protein [Myxococcales bacterium]